MLGHVPAHAPGWMGNRLTVSIFRGTREPRIPCADHVLAHAGTCWHMLAHASPCGHVLVHILAHASTCWHMPALKMQNSIAFIRICEPCFWDMAGTWPGTPGTWPDTPGTWPDTPGTWPGTRGTQIAFFVTSHDKMSAPIGLLIN